MQSDQYFSARQSWPNCATLVAAPPAAAWVLAPIAAAQGMPACAASPVPVTGFEYRVPGNPTKAIEERGAAGFGFSIISSCDGSRLTGEGVGGRAALFASTTDPAC